MPTARSSRPGPAPAGDTPPSPAFRSAAVARMAQMPVATLRIWEQRHQAVRPATAPSGHRHYSPADVQRVLLLRQLTGQGHAIGSIAGLETPQLLRLSRPPGVDPAGAEIDTPAASPVLRIAVVGPALALRLQRPAVNRHATRARVVAMFESLADAAVAAAAAPSTPADLLLWLAPELRPDLPAELPAELAAARDACGAARLVVMYRFAGASATRALAALGAEVLREPADDLALGTWLASAARRRPARERVPGASDAAPPVGALAPRRFDDATLTSISGLSSTLACECPRHVAELLMQLSSFERYSAGCVDRSPADAALHAYLQQVAGASRALFESALERVAQHEGLTLP